jgi:hypothetical protein
MSERRGIDGLRRLLGASQINLERFGLEREIRLRLDKDGKLHPDSDEDRQMIQHCKALIRAGKVPKDTRVPIEVISDGPGPPGGTVQFRKTTDGRWHIEQDGTGDGGE